MFSKLIARLLLVLTSWMFARRAGIRVDVRFFAYVYSTSLNEEVMGDASSTGRIRVSMAFGFTHALGTLLHELQHAYQWQVRWPATSAEVFGQRTWHLDDMASACELAGMYRPDLYLSELQAELVALDSVRNEYAWVAAIMRRL